MPRPLYGVTFHWVASSSDTNLSLGCFVDHPWYDLNVTPERPRGIPKNTTLVGHHSKRSISLSQLPGLRMAVAVEILGLFFFFPPFFLLSKMVDLNRTMIFERPKMCMSTATSKTCPITSRQVKVFNWVSF